MSRVPTAAIGPQEQETKAGLLSLVAIPACFLLVAALQEHMEFEYVLASKSVHLRLLDLVDARESPTRNNRVPFVVV